MNTTNLEVNEFLNSLKSKLLISEILFMNREKNEQTLLALGITYRQCSEYIKKLEEDEYVSGPKAAHYGTPLWVFGKTIYGKEIYIKIQLNVIGKPVICISFHIAEHPLNYPFKQ